MALRYLISATAVFLPIVRAMTPEQMISAPRYSANVPNPSGEWAVYSSSNYSFDTHESSTSWHLMKLPSGEISDLPFGADVAEMLWLGPTDTSVIYVNGTNEQIPGGVSMWSADLADSPITPVMIGGLPAPYSGMKATMTESGDINFLMNCLAYANNGSAYNEELATKPWTTGRLYDNIYVRHWDQYLTQQRYAVFAGTLKSGHEGYSFDGQMTNLLQGMDAPVTRPESPVQPFGGSGDYDLSPDGSQAVFLTKAPELSKANYTASYLYLVPHDGSAVAKNLNGPGSNAPAAAQGASGGPSFSPDGTRIAYFQQDGIAYESDRNKVYIADINTMEITQLADAWDSSPSTFKWSHDCNELWVASDYQASTRLFILPVDAGAEYSPTNITDVTSVSDYYLLPDGSALVSSSAVWSSHNVYLLQKDSTTTYLYLANEIDPELSGLSPQDISYMWYEGTLGDQQQAVVIHPTDFDPSSSYPLIFYIHGGPQGVTGNSWSTRWNLKTWADQGYVLVGPNPTGSTSYGQNLTDRIQNRWGSWPYEDLVNAHSYACANLAYINCSNAVSAGASFGGYMGNWLHGQPALSTAFRAQVVHDGVTSTLNQYATEELWFMQHDFNGTLWDDRENYERYNPIDHIKSWTTPMFVIHNDLDYRLPVSEGIMLFNILQERGIPSRFLNFPDEGHWVQGWENSLFWHREVFDWINFWSGLSGGLDGEVITE
ncbi:hypothetical protein MBLNU230_g5560t1 [Neophaeotheca triangularis]